MRNRKVPEQVKAVQELRRSSAASPVTRKKPRKAERREAIREQEKDD
jgi:hypothetical protein